ncbi:C39 family peptidase [Lactobacillus sp. ESL0785]|uniref:C39 family peptidase n=1 Tax=Lactobacillus sp. ESL0785 TaxID=2983232 RepID=UPI0023FA107F|nr:C39 family peptidase [Lactobacillus sp. ESL0785]WEV70799.1 C39 family peptidase [Lactobacillus sp. ESL0785]
MKTIYHFNEAQPIIVSSHSGGLINDQRQVIGTCDLGQHLTTSALAQDKQKQLYFVTAQGLLAFSAAYFVKLHYFSNLQLNTPIKWGKVKKHHGTGSYSTKHQFLYKLPLEHACQIVGQGEDIFHHTWLRTITGNWLKKSDLWLDGQPLITQKHDLKQKETIIVNPQGTIAVNSYGQKPQLIEARRRLPVKAIMEDVFGNEYLQVAANLFIPSTDCLLHSLPEHLPLQHPYQLTTENINQMFWQVQNGCEAASLLMGLHYHHHLVNCDYQEFINTMPLAADYNPYHGFGGSPYENVKGRFEAIFPPALLAWGRNYTALRDLNGADTIELIAALKRGNPVLTYVTTNFTPPDPDNYPWGKTYKNNHAVLLDGFSEDLFHVSDPIDGHYWLNKAVFMQAYAVRKWAIEIE